MPFHEFGIAGVGEPHVAVSGQGFAFGVGGVVGNIAFVFHAQRGAAVFFAAEDGLLLLQRGSIPKFYEMADKAHGLVAAVFGPGRFVFAVFSHAAPHYSIGGFGLGHIGIAGAVAETEQVAGSQRAGLGLRQKAVDTPADNGKLGGVFNQVAQGVLAGFGAEGADLDTDVAVAPFALQFVVGEVFHFLQMLGLMRSEAETFVKQAVAHAERDGEAVRFDDLAEDAAALRGEFGIAVLQFAAFGEEICAGSDGAKKVFEFFGGFGQHVEGGHDGELLVGRGDAGLVGAVEGEALVGMVIGAAAAVLRCAAFGTLTFAVQAASGQPGGSGANGEAFEEIAFGRGLGVFVVAHVFLLPGVRIGCLAIYAVLMSD